MDYRSKCKKIVKISDGNIGENQHHLKYDYDF